MADVYDVTLRFECEDPSLAAAVMHEVIMALSPSPDDDSLVQNPRIWDVQSSALREFGDDYQHKAFDLAFKLAGTATRDRAYHWLRIGRRVEG